MTSPFSDMTVGAIVAEDFRAAAVLERFGIDFCCGGKRTLGEACDARGCDEQQVASAIAQVRSNPERSSPPDSEWDVAALVAHIVATHHAYVRESMPRIAIYLQKLIAAHGERHPELARIAEHFAVLTHELTTHMFKEEQVLFPYVRELAAISRGGAPPRNVFGSVRNPIRMMEAEHAGAGRELAIVRELSDGYTPPEDGCATYRVCYQELEAFDHDLRRHIHLENNVLFPKAVMLERATRTHLVD
jgi:regulator of cell morphogenesis and NO signaling